MSYFPRLKFLVLPSYLSVVEQKISKKVEFGKEFIKSGFFKFNKLHFMKSQIKCKLFLRLLKLPASASYLLLGLVLSLLFVFVFGQNLFLNSFSLPCSICHQFVLLSLFFTLLSDYLYFTVSIHYSPLS